MALDTWMGFMAGNTLLVLPELACFTETLILL